MFLSIHTNNYASLTIGIKWSKGDQSPSTLFFLENFEQANLSESSCKIVEDKKLSRLIVKIFWPKKYLQTNNRDKENKSKEKYTQNVKNYEVQQ